VSPDVFISYSRENQQEVIKLVEYLRAQGVAVWMDESDIHGATMWTKEIVEAIRASSVFILAISRHSTGSKNVVKELALASEREKIILPIYLEQCDIPETMEYQLAGIQNIALHTLDKGKSYEFVHQTIRRLGVGRAQSEDQALGQAEAAPGTGHGTGVGHGHMAPPKAKGGAGKWIGIAAAVVVLCVAGFFLSQGGSNAPAPTSPGAAASPAAPVPADGTARIALLPIEVNAPTEDDKWVGGGMGTQLRAAINKLDGVAIISGVSVNAYRGSNRDINKIRENLNVNYILDCEMAVAGKNVTAIVEFINTSNLQTVWSETYEDNVDSIFNIKTDITTKIAQSVGVKVETETAKQISQKSTQNSEAFKLYTQGRTLWFTRTEADMRQSLKLYKQAIELDPDYAEPFTGIADSHSMLVQYGYAEIKEGYSKAREAAIEAITRNPNLPQAYVSLAWVQFAYDWKLKASEKNYRKAIELDPKFAQAYHWLSINLSTQGKFEESYGIIQSALKLDPNNHVILMNSSLPARKLGYYLIAETNTKLGLSLSPNYLLNWLSLYQTYLDQENKENEIKSLILDVESISDKDRNIYDLLVHYYWKKDKNKFESYLSAARSYIDNETRGEHNLDYYLITEGKLDDLLLTANQRFKDGRFNYNFCSNIFISDFFNDKKVASLIKLIQAGKD